MELSLEHLESCPEIQSVSVIRCRKVQWAFFTLCSSVTLSATILPSSSAMSSESQIVSQKGRATDELIGSKPKKFDGLDIVPQETVPKAICSHQ